MQLKPWLKEPETSGVLAIFVGKRHRFERFVQVWLGWRGDLDLRATPLDPARLPWTSAHDGAPPCAYAIAIRRLPPYYLIGWWLRQPEWQLFYRKRDDEEFETPTESEDVRPGFYLRWGYEADRLPKYTERAVLLLGDQQGLKLPPANEFRNLFDFHPDRQAVFLGPDGPLPRSAARADSSTNSTPYILPLRLVQELGHQRPPNPEAAVRRLQHEINNLQEQLERLRWWGEQPEVTVSLHVYPETENRQPGSVWGLCDWFTRASDHALEQFHHVRVVIESLGALHLVVPANFNREPTASLPDPMYRLILDWRWQRKGRHVFVPKFPASWELWPPPPRDSKHIEDLLIERLWEGADLGDTLVLLRTTAGEEYRFAVNGFQPLATQVEALNIQVAIAYAQRNRDLENTSGMKKLLGQVRLDIQTPLESHATAMRQELDALWAGDRADLDHYRQQVREALDQVQRIQESQEQIRGIERTDWATWSAFRQEVLNLDRQLLPSLGNGLGAQLAQFDQLRGQLAELWHRDTPGDRRQLANAIRTLAERVENGR